MSFADLPVIRDYLDRRATSRISERPLVEAVAVTGPAFLVGLNAILGTLTELLGRISVLALASDAVLALTCVVSLLYVLTSRDQAPQRIYVAEKRDIRAVYRFSRAARLAAKLTFVPLVCLSLWTLWSLLPNGIAGRRGLGGFVSVRPGVPSSVQGTVDALDALGRSVSKEPSVIGTSGFFYIVFRPEAAKAQSIRIQAPECGDTIIDISTSTPRLRTRETVERSGDQDRWPEWLIWCSAIRP